MEVVISQFDFIPITKQLGLFPTQVGNNQVVITNPYFNILIWNNQNFVHCTTVLAKSILPLHDVVMKEMHFLQNFLLTDPLQSLPLKLWMAGLSWNLEVFSRLSDWNRVWNKNSDIPKILWHKGLYLGQRGIWCRNFIFLVIT